MIDVNNLLSGTYNPSNSPPITGQTITATAPSTNVFNLQSARDIGAGSDIKFVFQVTQAFATLTSLQIAIQSSADNSAWVNLLLSPVLLQASLVAGTELSYVLPKKQLLDPAGGTPNQYLRVNYTVAGSDATTGQIICAIVPVDDEDQQQYYGPNYTVGSGT